MLAGPSGGGNTLLLINMILDMYKGCFSRICIWQPNLEADNAWKPMTNYTRDTIKPNDRKTLDDYDPSDLEAFIKTTKSSRLPNMSKT